MEIPTYYAPRFKKGTMFVVLIGNLRDFELTRLHSMPLRQFDKGSTYR